jgi:glycine/D-amino acid oxidase-like deaminating enzyme/nitrite reductase/ring-hydroxylating ferredoxin subunit
MQSDSGATTSIWMDTVETLDYPPLEADTHTQVCVVGAGIAGITTAYSLAREGKTVLVIDDGPVGGGETGRTTAHLVSALDDRYFDLEKLFGNPGSRCAAESHTSAIQRIESIVATENIDCDFARVDGFLVLAEGDTRALLERELAAAHRASLTDVVLVDRVPLESFDTGPVLRFPRQAQFHPLKYLHALAHAIVRNGGRIYCGTRAQHIAGGASPSVTTSAGPTIFAEDIVVATNSPVNDWMAMHTKQAPYRTYVVGLRIPRGTLSPLLFWDTADPYHYVRGQYAHNSADDQVLIVGGEDHKTGQAADMNERFGCLEAWARQRFTTAGEVVYRWSGQVLEPVDSLAFIGKNPGNEEHIYIATGDSGNGMTHGTIAGMLLTDLIMGRDNPWATLYDPHRITLRAAPRFAKQNANVAEQYAEWLTPGEVTVLEDIPNNSGAVMRRGIHKIAVYKDSHGNVTEKSAKCPHLYGVVHWNDTEKTWDCPCHGSRFTTDGTVVNGPAIDDLEDIPERSAGTPS